jgi:hypothetical protein
MKLFLFLALMAISTNNFVINDSTIKSNDGFGFITRSSDKLMDGTREFRFIGMNTPNIHVQEDNSFLTKGWHRINEYEIRDAFRTIQLMGGTVTRSYVFSVRGGINNPNLQSHINGPGQYDEEMFRDFDMVLKLANEYKIRLIVPFVDNWDWWGGTMRLAAFRGKKQSDFCTDPQLKVDYKDLVKFVLNRTNTYTGVKYHDDPAILAWETGNELGIENSNGNSAVLDQWTEEMAAYIKSIDTNHLVNDGKNSYSYGLSEAQVVNPHVDMVTEHYYSGDYIASCIKARNLTKGKKVFYVGEFNSADISVHEKLFNEVIADGTSGAMVWSLRYHSKDGGFYYHSERSDAANPCYRWPGFASAPTDEANKMAQVRKYAYRIRCLEQPRLSVPDAPYLIPESTPVQLRWRGSAGAVSYIIERADNRNDKWLVIDTHATEDGIPYAPYVDKMAAKGHSYYYRLKAENASGISSVSNVIGPITY